MSEETYRRVPALYYFVTPRGNPTAITAYGEGSEVFVFFSSEEKARAYQKGLGLPPDWRLIPGNVAERLIEICRMVRDDMGCEDIALDPPPPGGGPVQPFSPREMIEIIENTAALWQEHGRAAWPSIHPTA